MQPVLPGFRAPKVLRDPLDLREMLELRVQQASKATWELRAQLVRKVFKETRELRAQLGFKVSLAPLVRKAHKAPLVQPEFKV